MNIDELARQAADEVRSAGRSMPIVPIRQLSRRRVVARLTPALAAGISAWIAWAMLVGSPDAGPPVVSSPTTIDSRSDETTAVPTETRTFDVTAAELDNLWSVSKTVTPLTELADPCCAATGADGETLVLDDHMLLGVKAPTRVFAEWDDVDGVAVVWTEAGAVIAGTASDGSGLLRLFGHDGAELWTLPIDAAVGDDSDLAVDSEGVIWLARNGLLPVEVGFAPVQWTPVATLEGVAVPADRRSEARPLPDGRSVRLSENSVELIETDGSRTSWHFPEGFTLLSANAFQSGLVVTAATDEDSMIALSLRPESQTTAIRLDSPPASPGTITVDDSQLTWLGHEEGGSFISTTQLDALDPLPLPSLDDAAWVVGTYDSVLDDTGRVLARFPFRVGSENVAWDGSDGLVIVTESGVAWIRPGGTLQQTIPIDEIVEVALVGERHVLGGRALGGTVEWYELETARRIDPPEGRTVVGETFQAQGRTATVLEPDWRDVERGEAGEPIPPFDLPEVVVEDTNGSELRFPVGTTERPHVQIHDFDGRRLIVSAVPQEPATPPQTTWIIDLECANCTRVVETDSPQTFDLVRTLSSDGDIVEPQLPE